MRDADVRHVLMQRLEKQYGGDPSTLIVEELGLRRGTIRADLAVVNGSLKGYEIKSDQDTLVRLGNQAATYSKIFDTVTIVVAERHLCQAESIVPTWWGLDVVKYSSQRRLLLTTIRTEAANSHVDPECLVELLWRDEVLALLARLGRLESLKSKPRRILWDALATSVSLPELKEMVRTSLKNRSGWRADSRRTRGDEMFPPSAMSSDYLFQHVLPRSRRYTHRPS